MNINANTLNYYIQNAQISFELLKSKIKNLEEFLSGEKQPTFSQLSEIAKKINVPTGLLLLDEPINIEDKRLDFRTINSNELEGMSEELRDTIIEMEIKQDFLSKEIHEKLEFIGKYSIHHDVDYIAKIIREKLGLPLFFQNEAGKNPLNYLRDKINVIGVFVFFNGKVKDNTHRPLSLNEFRGFVLLNDKAPIIFINQKDTKAGQLFTLVHELVHIFVGSEEIFNIVDTGDYQFDRTEAFINKVTAEILVPKEILLSLDLTDTKKIANKFKVSEFVIIRRLLDLNKISLSEYHEKVSELKAFFDQIPRIESNGGDYKNNINFRIDKRFFNYIESAIRRDRISYTDAFNIIGVGIKGYKALREGNGYE